MDVEAVARDLSFARRSCSLLEPPSRRHPSFSLQDGYAVGRLLHRESVASGWRPVGVKLGFTNQAIWSQLGLDSPFWAPMYDKTLCAAREVSLEGLVAPRIEPEIVLGLSADLQPGASSAEVSAAIGWAAAGFEIVQCHYPNWEMTPPDAIADAGLHGLLVVGQRMELDLEDGRMLADVKVELRKGDASVADGSGSDALGGPVEAVTWLLRVPGVEALRAGSIVTTGTLTAAFPIAPAETWHLRTQGPVGLGEIHVGFA